MHSRHLASGSFEHTLTPPLRSGASKLIYFGEGPIHIVHQQGHLFSDHDTSVRRSIAANPRLPLEFLAQLASDPNFSIRAAVARNSRTPESILLRLASDQDAFGYVQQMVAENAHTSDAALRTLASQAMGRVRQAVAGNPRTPEAMLIQFTSDPSAVVRSYVARNPRTPKATLMHLASDSDSMVRVDVARNPRTPEAALASLALDPDGAVQAWALGNPATSEATLFQVLSDLRRGKGVESLTLKLSTIGWHPSFSRHALETLEVSENETVRQIATK